LQNMIKSGLLLYIYCYNNLEVKNMPATEIRRIDKFVNRAFLGKREIGRPLKYNIRNQGRTGWVELVFNPRTRVQEYVSDAIKFAHPYIFAMTYKFHVEKAKEAGEYP
jgi:hypothetical protein